MNSRGTGFSSLSAVGAGGVIAIAMQVETQQLLIGALSSSEESAGASSQCPVSIIWLWWLGTAADAAAA